MCEPATLTAIAIGTTAASGGFSAYSSYQQGKATKKYMDSQADQRALEGKYALDVADRQSTAIQNTAKNEGRQLKESQAEFNSSVVAGLAANGISGVTSQDITNNNFSKEKMDELVLRNNADVQSWQVNTEGKYRNWQLLTEAEDLRYQGRMANSSGKKQAFSTLLSSAASVASMGAGGFGSKGTNLGPGTTSQGISVPSRYKPRY